MGVLPALGQLASNIADYGPRTTDPAASSAGGQADESWRRALSTTSVSAGWIQ